ncbi:MAG: nucleoside triphosphate pyrophosphohydrolase [Bacteroidetes bacterium]|nr:nucleoside triphosphate pyrophosphohydrolase [Rhodothermia bacterium]MCS7154523.1 nucleoside triphosphate pyrophosphohydrolase [Bacteroidota bacterium]MCX7906896.1 nucleoside triphosphate pyrophosphohydrolase [Bacteroidota bacterium]MDW8136825.1 nucleoside triphosphate pyrophosphohydrolase [Bacteroidota bacterium]MDW8285305.1 nucleoside triphosphate pyrophosphohydrolase [Bacteroidota bacterium]
MHPATDAYERLVAIVARLRRECPWDRAQTPQSIKSLLIEEAYETVEAIDREAWDELRGELGDLLLHVLFHAVMAEEAGRFTLRDVLEGIAQKLVRRHPHVFGSTSVSGAEEVLRNWEQLKLAEGRRSALDGVPRNLPALLRAHRMQEKASKVGFDWADPGPVWGKVREELQEWQEAIRSGSPEDRRRELGDVLFALVNYARFLGLNAEEALQEANERFLARFRYIEERLREQGRTPQEATLEEMDRLWEEAKARLPQGGTS